MFGLSEAAASIITKALGTLAVLGALWFLWHEITTTYYDKGAAATEAKYVKRDADATAAFEAERNQLARERDELTHELNMAALNAAKEKEDAEKELARVRADAASGKLRLRDPGVSTGACTNSTARTVTAATSGSNDTSGAELPATGIGVLSYPATDFLIGIWGQCDQVARRLGLAQKTILEYQERYGFQETKR